MHAAALRVELRIPAVVSLKEKRRRVKSLTAALTRNFSVSVAEVDHHDLWQRAALGVAMVAPQAGQLQRLMHSVQRFVEKSTEVEVLSVEVFHLEQVS